MFRAAARAIDNITQAGDGKIY